MTRGHVLGCLGEGLVELGLSATDDEVGLGYGGDAANAAVMAASLGAPARFYGRVGDDVLGRRLTAFWRSRGVDLAGLSVDPGAPTGIYVNELSGDGAHRFDYHRAGSSGSRYDTADVVAAPFGDLAILHVTGIGLAVSPGLADAVETAVRRAAAAGALTSFGVNFRAGLRPDHERLRRLLELADIAFLSLEDAEALYGAGDRAQVERALAGRPGRETILTLGAEGAVGWADGRRFSVVALPVAVVDAAGAGDALAGAYLAGRLGGLDPEASLALGVAAAGQSTRARGCALSYPTSATLASPELAGGAS